MRDAETPTLNACLESPIVVGEPDVSGPLAVFPLFGPSPSLQYQSFAQGHVHGVSVKELGTGASVNDLVVTNPTTLPVLLFEGEEVLGAQQNRTFDVSVLVDAQSTVKVPVSCVEAGRWDGSRHDEAFAPAPQAAYPALRQVKNRAVYASVVAGAEARADQGAVWEEVDHKLDDLDAQAPTRAIHDGYEQRRRELDAMALACTLKPEQTGALVAIAGEFTVLDRVSQPLVFASLWGPLLQGYALDALGRRERTQPSVEDAQAYVDAVAAAPILERNAIGLGRDIRLATPRGTGAGVVCEGELIQLSVFTGGSSRETTRIARPSRRRA